MKKPTFPADRIDPNYNPKGNFNGLGIILLIASLMIGGTSDYLPKGFPIETVVAISFVFFLLGIYLLILSKND